MKNQSLPTQRQSQVRSMEFCEYTEVDSRGNRAPVEQVLTVGSHRMVLAGGSGAPAYRSVAPLDQLGNVAAAAGVARAAATASAYDRRAVQAAGIEEALVHRISPSAPLTDNGRQYRGMSLLEMGRDYLESAGHSTRGMDRFALTRELMTFRSSGMHGTSDFSSILANVASKRLRAAYEEASPTYTLWARRGADATDFREMSITQLSGAPDLLPVNEHGEFKFGTMADGVEKYSMLTYGRMIGLSRQAMINDDMRAFGRLVDAFGAAARRLENRLVYAQLTANAALADGVALFHADHANLGTGGGSALQFSALSAARAAMRQQKGLQSEVLNLAPSYLVVPAALEQTAYQLTSAQYTPATSAAVNEFRTGGRSSLMPVVEPLLDATSATAWYLAAATNQTDTVEYCYLNGSDGPVIEQKMGFEVDGMSFKARLDFATKAIDYRGLYRANGA